MILDRMVLSSCVKANAARANVSGALKQETVVSTHWKPWTEVNTSDAPPNVKATVGAFACGSRNLWELKMHQRQTRGGSVPFELQATVKLALPAAVRLPKCP